MIKHFFADFFNQWQGPIDSRQLSVLVIDFDWNWDEGYRYISLKLGLFGLTAVFSWWPEGIGEYEA